MWGWPGGQLTCSAAHPAPPTLHTPPTHLSYPASPNLPSKQALVEGLRSCVWVPLPEGWSEHHHASSARPYYVNAATGAKQWERPEVACALVQSTEASHMQPRQLQPRRSSAAEAEAVPA